MIRVIIYHNGRRLRLRGRRAIIAAMAGEDWLVAYQPGSLTWTKGGAVSEPGEVAAQHCQCCGGELPPRPIWETNRDRAGECSGSVDAETGRCRAFSDPSLWSGKE